MTPADPARVAAARRWFRAQGHAPVVADGVTVLATPAHPTTWESNCAWADPGVGIAALEVALARALPHMASQVVHTDALTDPMQEAELAQAGFATDGVVIELLARGAITPRSPRAAVTLRRVAAAADCAAFEALVGVDRAEGRRTGGRDPAVAAGLLANMHRRMATCDYALLIVDGTPVGYGLTVACPDGLGLIEHLFTHPDWRGRGLMSAFIVDAAAALRATGCDDIFLDAHADDTPRLLYAALGFAPVAVARTWTRPSPESQP